MRFDPMLMLKVPVLQFLLGLTDVSIHRRNSFRDFILFEYEEIRCD